MSGIVATTRIKHNGKWLKEGDEISPVSDEDKADLIAMGMARKKELTLGGMAEALSDAVDHMRTSPTRRQQYSRRNLKSDETGE